MYNLLFSTAWSVLKDFGNTKKWIGGTMGAMAILHTWGQNLHYHPHLHFIVPAGALMANGKWKHSRSRGRYLFNINQLKKVYRARFIDSLHQLFEDKQINGELPKGLYEKDWVIYAKQPFGGPKQVINYLGRYTHRTAISNDRILDVTQSQVTFSWKDYKQDYARRITTIRGERFLQLFCMHILPHGFTRIRHYGFLSSASKKKSLALIRAALKVAKPPVIENNWKDIVFKRMGITPGVCKRCGGPTVIIEVIPNMYRSRQRAPPVLKADHHKISY
jgi:hypothetical protein